MANEGEENNSVDVTEAEQAFGYTNLKFTDPAKQETYTLSKAKHNQQNYIYKIHQRKSKRHNYNCKKDS